MSMLEISNNYISDGDSISANSIKDKIISDDLSLFDFDTQDFIDAVNRYKGCTDGKDDGKIGFIEGVKSFFKGVGNKVKEQVGGLGQTVKEHPVKTFLTLAAVTGACVVGGPVVVGALSAVGAVTAGVGMVKSQINIVNGIVEASNATSDYEKREILENLGADSTEFVENAALGVASVASAGQAIQSIKGSYGAAAVSSVDDAARAGANSVDDAVRAGADSVDDAARAGADSVDDAVREAQEKIDLLNQKYKNGELSQQEWKNLVDDEYMKIRKLGKYSVDYGANNYSDTLNNIDDAIRNPKTRGVNLHNENGWTYRANGDFISPDELGQRMSLNVKGDSRLIKQLDDLMVNGQYVDDYGNIVRINRTDFYYKTYPNASQWGLREDPITIYFKGDINPETLDAIGQITKSFQRGALSQASKSVPWMYVEENPTSAAIYNLINYASKINTNLARCIYNICYHGNGAYICSSGQYNAFVNIINEYKSLINIV